MLPVWGGILTVIIPKPGKDILSLTLGGAAGIMVAVTVLDLIPSAWLYGTPLKFSLGMAGGVLFLKTLDMILSRMTIGAYRERDRRYLLNLGYLVTVGIVLHDLPEGMAIAVGYEAANRLGMLIAFAIGLHNVPEGMAIGIPLRMGGMPGRWILLTTGLASLFTPAGALIGQILVSFSRNYISLLLAAAAGAMIFIVFRELWPEAKRGRPDMARLGLAAGVLIIGIVSLIN